MKTIPYGRQTIDKADINTVAKALQSNWITQGPRVEEFEHRIAKYCGVKYAVAVSSGTAALHLACLASDLKKGDEVITSPISFLATANSILYAGAKPVFCDIDYETVNINPQQISEKITKRTKAISVVHFAGYPCDMEEISHIAKKKNIIVIEDACHALGAEYKSGQKRLKVGSCKHSLMSVFSFHPVKHITTGEGGAVTTNDKKTFEKLKALRNHGIHKDKKTAQKGMWYYEMRELGFNYRITDFQCSLGLSQIKRIDSFIRKRRWLAHRYNEKFLDIEESLRLPTYADSDKAHAWHLYLLRLRLENMKISRKAIYTELQKKNIGVQIHYIPIYKQPFYRKSGYSRTSLPNAERYYRECLSLPIYASLDEKTQDYIIKVVKNIIKKHSK